MRQVLGTGFNPPMLSSPTIASLHLGISLVIMQSDFQLFVQVLRMSIKLYMDFFFFFNILKIVDQRLNDKVLS